MEQVRIFASCHNHSTYSDGEYTPETLARIAKNMGHGGIILTDHDTVNGYPFMKEAAEKYGLLTMVGCEFSTVYKNKGFHLCGFDFDTEHPEMKALLDKSSSIQTKRTELMFKWGLERGTLREGITWQDVLDDHPHHNYFCNNEVFASMLKRGIYRYDEYGDVIWVTDPVTGIGSAAVIRVIRPIEEWETTMYTVLLVIIPTLALCAASVVVTLRRRYR